MKQVWGLLCHMSRITSLNLGSAFGIGFCTNVFLRLPSTEIQIRLTENFLGDETTKDVCDCIYNMPDIETLRLSHNAIGTDGATYISAALANKHRLTFLSLICG
eukprot:c6568_g1_i2.p1 GENE.c6568_g1_i2~~c6568_g1_i2.p1  ORF type:complete len:104 (-),score=19.95 c6568_g1_i2:380-691(-)